MVSKVIRVNDLRDSSFNLSLTARRNDEGGHTMASDQWQLVIHIRILRELEKLNTLLACPNFVGASMDASNPDGLSHCGRPEHPSHPMALGAQPAGRPSACFES